MRGGRRIAATRGEQRPTSSVDASNRGQAETWDGEEGERWARFATRYDAAVRGYETRLLEAAGFGPTDDVLDVGCGCGETTRNAARLAASGTALGVDLSLAMLEVARRRAGDEGLANARFERADAQVHPFEDGAFGVAVSRFGASFFGDPATAFRNVSRALQPGGRLAIATWQGFARNEWLVAIRGALAAGRELPEPPSGGPGPFGLADPGVLREILADAGFDRADVEDVTEPVYLGADADDAFAFVRELGLTRGLLDELDEASASMALERLRATLAEHDTGAGVLVSSRAWLATARRP